MSEQPCNKPNEPGVGQCCCNCVYRLNDYSHPGTDGGSILELRGYICSPPIEDGEQHAFSGWTEHGGCEMWSDKELAGRS